MGCHTNHTHPCLGATTRMRMATPQHSLGTLARHLLTLSKVTINLPMQLLHKDTSKEGLLPLSKATLVHNHRAIPPKVLLPRDIPVIPNNLSGDKHNVSSWSQHYTPLIGT